MADHDDDNNESQGGDYRARVLWDWSGENQDDLPLLAGDLILLQNWDGPEWWYGSINGNKGVTPVLPPPESHFFSLFFLQDPVRKLLFNFEY